MELKLNNATGTVAVDSNVFDAEFNEGLVHQVVTAYFAAGRAGTKAQKTRSEVSGGGAKPWKQKGSGRARAGTIRSPLWRKGGVTFAAKPRNYEQKVNRKVYRNAIRGILSELVRQERFSVVEQFDVPSLKTKDFVAYLNASGFGSDVLLVTDNGTSNLYLASRNLAGVSVIDVKAIDPVILLYHGKVVFDKEAVKSVSEWLA
ncbi:MAG: 50S ribosomal protein L4 [Cardiobacteriaceae bacterium]|nr:50S ribosomal protein L4 [Cardiobacteriaceae bacterium]